MAKPFGSGSPLGPGSDLHADRAATLPGTDRALDARAAAPPFVLPRGLSLDLSGQEARASYDGDIEISADLGWHFASIRAGGDLVVHLPVVYGDLIAGGVLRVSGDVESNGVIHGREVILGDQNIRCRVISADERITIGAANIAAEVILAPEIHIDPGAQGRVTVIESYNERDATKIKGGFSLSDYEDMFGNSVDFLAQRGLRPLSGPRPRTNERPRISPRPEPATGNAPRFDVTPGGERTQPGAPFREAGREGGPFRESAYRGAGGNAGAGPFDPHDAPTPYDASRTEMRPPPTRGRQAEEDVEDPMSMSIEDMEALGRRRRAQDELQVRLVDALERILGSYAGAEVPPPVLQLRTLIEQRDYDGMRATITDVWNGLLAYHQKKGIRPHHQVTHAFNMIHGLVHH